MSYPIRTYIPRKSSILILSAKVLQKQVPKHTHIYLFREEMQPNPVIDWMNKRQGTGITDKMMPCMFPIDHISEEERKRNKRNGICPYLDDIACDHTKTKTPKTGKQRQGIPILGSRPPWFSAYQGRSKHQQTAIRRVFTVCIHGRHERNEYRLAHPPSKEPYPVPTLTDP